MERVGLLLPEGEADKMIEHLQAKKMEIMADFKEKRENINNAEFWKEKESQAGARLIKMDEEGRYIWAKGDETTEEVSLGEVMTDGEWQSDQSIVLDSETVPYNVRKRFLLEDSRIQLRELLDQQIVMSEISNPDAHWMKREAYQHSMMDDLEGVERPGIIAEKMVRLFLTKLAYDFQGAVKFEVIPPDIHEDVDEKLDFIIVCKPVLKWHKRGVQVDSGQVDSNEVTEIGRASCRERV